MALQIATKQQQRPDKGKPDVRLSTQKIGQTFSPNEADKNEIIRTQSELIIKDLFELIPEESEGVDNVFILKNSETVYIVSSPLYLQVRLWCAADTYQVKKIAHRDFIKYPKLDLLRLFLTK